MGDVIFFLMIGLGIGSIYATLGVGIVVVYKGSGVINFAQGAMAMYGAFTYDELRTNGKIQLPWVDFLPGHSPNIPVGISLGTDSVAFVPAVIISLLMAVVIGLMVHFLVFKPLRNAAPLGKLIGSLGVLLYLQGVALVNFGTAFRQPESVVPDEPIFNFLGLGKPYPRGALYAAGFAILIGVVLHLVYQRTRFGLATRAAAGNEKGAVLLGYSPNFLAAVNWVIASVIATAAAIVVGPIQGTLTPVGMTALVVPALGAALIGGMSSILIATIGGLGIGATQALFGFWANQDWFPEFFRNGVREAIPLIAIAGVLYLRGDKLPLRGTVEERRLPLSPQPRRLVEHMFVWPVIILCLAWTLTGKWSFGLTTGLITAIVMLSIVVLTGYVGQISLAQLSLSGVSAFFMARMMADGSTTAVNPFPVSGPDLPWPIAGTLGVLVAIAVGMIIGLPALRIRGVQLAVVTLAAAIALQTLYLENAELTGIRAGAPAAVRTPTFFGIDIGSVGGEGLTDRPAFIVFVLVVLMLSIMLVVNLRVTGTGRRFLAVRANERAAAAAGVSVPRTKLLAFGISAGLAGLSGVMLAFQQNNVASAAFVFGLGLSVVAFAYLAGITSINGALVAGMLVPASLIAVTSNHYFADTNIERYTGVLGGLGIIVTAIIHPEGIAPFFQQGMRHLGGWIVDSTPGFRSLRTAYQKEPARIGPMLAVLFAGAMAWLFFFEFTDDHFTRLVITAAVFTTAAISLARTLGPLDPTVGEAGQKWAANLRTFGPTALVGYGLGWLIFPLRVDTYSKLYMPLVGAFLALLIRSIGMRIYRAVTGQEDPMHAQATNGSGEIDVIDARDTAESEADETVPEVAG